MLYLKEKLTDAVAYRLLFGNFLENLNLVIKTQTLYKFILVCKVASFSRRPESLINK